MGLKYLGLKFKLFAAVLAVPITFLPLRPAGAQQGAPVVLPTIAVSPTLIPTPTAEVASSVTVISGEEIARMQRRTVTDVLMTVPGLNVVQSGSPGTLTAVFIRGTNSYHTKVLIDGMEVGDPSTTNGAIDLGHLMAYDIERIEILRGPQSGLYGSDAIGGVISITTKKGNGPAKVSGYVEGGSFGTFNQAMTLSGSFDRFDYAFNVAHYHYSNQPVTPPYMVPPGASAIGNAYDNWTASTRLGAQVNENLRFNFIGRSTNAKLLYSDDDPSAFPGLTFPEQSTYRNREFHGRLEAVLTLLEGRFVNTFGANYTNFNRSNKDPDPNPLTTFRSSRDKYDWHGNLTVMPGQVLVAGLERQNERAETDTVSARTGNSGGFLELQSEVAKRFFFVANIRHDIHDAFGDHTTWRVAPAVILPITDTKLKATYGTGFKAPTLYQLYGVGPFGFVGNPNLNPELSRGYDFGFEQPLGPRARFGITYFRNDIDNLIDFTFAPVFTNINVNRAFTYGYEAFIAVDVNAELGARLDYTHLTAKNGDTNADLLRRPHDKYSISGVWRATDRLTITPTLIYLGEWVDIDRATFVTRRTGNVATLNLAAEYAFNPQLTLFARADNLFNKVYENPLGWLQPGLAVYAGVKFATR